MYVGVSDEEYCVLSTGVCQWSCMAHNILKIRKQAQCLPGREIRSSMLYYKDSAFKLFLFYLSHPLLPKRVREPVCYLFSQLGQLSEAWAETPSTPEVVLQGSKRTLRSPAFKSRYYQQPNLVSATTTNSLCPAATKLHTSTVWWVCYTQIILHENCSI